MSEGLYHARKAAGRCTYCGGKRDDKKYNLCNKCRAYHRERYRKTVEKQTPEQHKAFNEMHYASANARNAKFRQQGLCVRCGAVSPAHWLCEVCYAKKKGIEAS